MDLQILWFCLIVILFVGFFFLEGFDYGVGIWLPFVARNDNSRSLVVSSVGGVWGGNEVWMIGAGGAVFAAFPTWYATMFSSFYFALLLILFAITLRGLGIEFRAKSRYRRWRYGCDAAFFIGSLLLAFLWGVFVGNLIRGIPINSKMIFTGDLLSLLNIYSLFTGVFFVLIFTMHGGFYLRLKIKRQHVITQRINRKLTQLWRITSVYFLFFVFFTSFETRIMEDTIALVTCVISLIALLLSGYKIKEAQVRTFVLSSICIVFLTLTVFIHNYPYVLISSLNHDWSLTVAATSSSHYSLSVMTVVAAIFIPIILLYQIFAHWAFRRRLVEKDVS